VAEPDRPRKLVWLVDSLDRLAGFPPGVRQQLGFALYQAQIGQNHQSAKVLHGFAKRFGRCVLMNCVGLIARFMFTQLGEAIYAPHVFQKKVTLGIATPQRELDLIRQRLQLARTLAGKTGD